MPTINFKDLQKEIPYKYKPQAVKYGKATMVAYIDARDAQDILDDTVGPENWQTEYQVVNGNLFCRVGIKSDGQWVWKSDCGTESNMDKEKGESSDAFKRACVQWGIGRFLYRLGVVVLPTKEYKGKEKPATHEGKILWNNVEISDYINNSKNKCAATPAPKKSPTNRYAKPDVNPVYAKVEYTEDTIKRVTTFDHDGLKGKECLLKNLEAFATAEKKEYKKISDLDDKAINKLMDTIEKAPPSDI